jgi:two-component system, LuxR family, sensor kinase FixL
MKNISTFRVALINPKEDIKPSGESLPLGVENDYCSWKITRFGHSSGPDLVSFLNPLEKRSAADFDLILDLPGPPKEEIDLPNLTESPPRVTGAAAAVVEQLVQQLNLVSQKAEVQRGIIDSATDAIITINEDHVIVGYNKGAEKIFGYTKAEALHHDLTLIIPPPYKEEHHSYVRRYLATRTARVMGRHVQLKAMRKNGEEFPMSISFSVAEIGDDLYFTGIVRDITEYVALEERLRLSERLAAVGDTIGHISHEIKNPLMIIGGFARQLLKASVLDDKGRQKLQMIAEEVERLENLMSDMKDFTRPPSLQKKMGKIDLLIDEVIAFFVETLEERGIKLIKGPGEPIPEYNFDPQQLKQVLVNLVKNAVEAMPHGGQITISTRLQTSYLEIEVTDTGEGMAEEVVENIFTPYFTTKSKGSGLGLVITSNIIKAHEGEIRVSSTPGKGSTFTIQLPLAGNLAQAQCRI